MEDVGDTLEELWISYNLIETLIGLAPHCIVLKTLYMAHNKIKDINELDRLKDLPSLTNCVFLGNEFYDKFNSNSEARLAVLAKLPRLTMIDNILVTDKERTSVFGELTDTN